MRPLRATWTRFRNLFRTGKLDRDLDAELAAHLELHIADNLRAGMSTAEARRQALLKLGGLDQTKDDCRSLLGFPRLDNLIRDAVFGFRMLVKNKGFSLVAILALALGIGFSSMVFSIFYNGILHPFTYRDPDRLESLMIFDTKDGDRPFRGAFQLDEVVAFRNQNHTLEDLSAITGWDVLYARRGGTEQLHGCVMTPNAIDFWGVRPLLGRGFLDRDTQPGADPVILLGYIYWQKEFRGDKSAVGTTMMLDGRPHTIIGVMPNRFYLWGADFYKPIAWNRPEPAIREAIANNLPYFFFATSRKKKGDQQRDCCGGPKSDCGNAGSDPPRELSGEIPFCDAAVSGGDYWRPEADDVSAVCFGGAAAFYFVEQRGGLAAGAHERALKGDCPAHGAGSESGALDPPIAVGELSSWGIRLPSGNFCRVLGSRGGEDSWPRAADTG